MRRSRFFLVDRDMKQETNTSLLRGACLVYAAYATHNYYRYNAGSSSSHMMEVLKQQIRESARNCSITMSAIDSRGY